MAGGAEVWGLAAAALVAIGLYGAILQADILRKIIACNLLAAGVFLVLGVVARRGAAGGLAADPVAQAMVVTGLVVAFAATALALMLTLRLFQTTGQATLAEEPPARDSAAPPA